LSEIDPGSRLRLVLAAKLVLLILKRHVLLVAVAHVVLLIRSERLGDLFAEVAN